MLEAFKQEQHDAHQPGRHAYVVVLIELQASIFACERLFVRARNKDSMFSSGWQAHGDTQIWHIPAPQTPPPRLPLETFSYQLHWHVLDSYCCLLIHHGWEPQSFRSQKVNITGIRHGMAI